MLWENSRAGRRSQHSGRISFSTTMESPGSLHAQYQPFLREADADLVSHTPMAAFTQLLRGAHLIHSITALRSRFMLFRLPPMRRVI
jgi:hypothetical protein